ncbi:MAG: NAD(P)/FAD-dependent oxidoreductase [Krumholzibacteria bacterium]|nr:NAD(P)/FAD-dependent oxidoreductase [Candidatus Krumholzibacteria bacterium]
MPGASATSAISARQRPRIVIVGGGFGGAFAVQRLLRRLRPDEAEVLLVDRNNYFVFHPFLMEAGTGSLPPQHAVVGLRAFTHSRGLLMGEFTGADFARRVIHVRPVGRQTTREVPYDHLVLAVGSVTSLPPIPGLREHALQIKGVADAIGLRDRAIRLLEQADQAEDPERRRALLHFVVVGSSFTGVEVAGELDAFLRRASRRYANVSAADVRITLVDIARRILPNLEEGLAAFAADKLRARGLDLRLGTSVRAVGPDHAELSDGTWLAAETVIWCAGIAPNPVLAGLDLPSDARGWILCEPDLRVQGHRDVWSIGDCAVNPGPDGKPYPATAQAAVQQGRAVADNLVRVLRGEAPEPCVIKDRGALVALGCRTGVARIGPLKLAGFPAWFLWRTVYLLKFPGWGRRLRVVLEWTIDLCFGRDDVQLGVRGATVAEHETTAAR